MDKDKINQVLLNLYLNGLQAMEHSTSEKELKVSVHRDVQAGFLVIEVKDTGSGILMNIKGAYGFPAAKVKERPYQFFSRYYKFIRFVLNNSHAFS